LTGWGRITTSTRSAVVAAILFNAIGCSKMKLFVDVAVEVSFLLTNLRWSSETFTMWLNMINIEGNVVYNRRISI